MTQSKKYTFHGKLAGLCWWDRCVLVLVLVFVVHGLESEMEHELNDRSFGRRQD